jgi:hypothetical protein
MGTLWEGRYRSSPIATDAYLLACCRYVELNPVRAHLSDDPAAYPWSSYRWHVGIGSQFGWLDIDPCFEGLGNCDDERVMRYREFVQSAIPAGECTSILSAVLGIFLCAFLWLSGIADRQDFPYVALRFVPVHNSTWNYRMVKLNAHFRYLLCK